MSLLNSPQVWIAMGVSALFIVTGIVMHRVFVRVLKDGSQESEKND